MTTSNSKKQPQTQTQNPIAQFERLALCRFPGVTALVNAVGFQATNKEGQKIYLAFVPSHGDRPESLFKWTGHDWLPLPADRLSPNRRRAIAQFLQSKPSPIPA